jgi:hypothetical protein
MPSINAANWTPARGGYVRCGMCAECGEGYEARPGVNGQPSEPKDRLCVNCARVAAGVVTPEMFLVATLTESLAADYADADRDERREAAEFVILFHLSTLPGLTDDDRYGIRSGALWALGLL